jgi:hypothetical protein
MFGKRVNPAIVITLTACFVFMMFFSAGCAKDPKAPEKPKEINITYVKNPLNVPSIVEKHEQLLEKEFGKDDIEINLLDLTSGSKQTEAVAAGSLDICNALGGTSAILAAANGVDLKIISIYSRAPKAFMLVTKSPDINSIADLKGKKVELLARVFDHTQHRYVKGFRKLTLGWSDGSSFIPLAFSLLSSKDPKNRLYEQGPDVPEHSPGNARREEAILSTNAVLLQLLDEVLEYTRTFNYVLFDSWFSWPKIIKEIESRNLNVICMLKDMPSSLCE